MIPAGYEYKTNYNKYIDSEDDDLFEFDFCDSTEKNQLKSPNEDSPNTSDENDKNGSDLNNNNYYDEQTDIILDELKSAITHKNLEAVKAHFQLHNLDININFKNDWTPLMYAASCGSWELCEYLITNGADVFFLDDSFSVIHSAAGCCDLNTNENALIKIIELLVSKGVDINSTDKYYQTPLMYACRAGNSNLVEFLATLNADLNAQDDNNWTALCHASSKGHLRCVQKLLKLNADPTLFTIDYFYPFDLAAKSGYKNVSSLIKRFLRIKKFENKEEFEKILNDDDTQQFDDNNNNLITNDDQLEIFLNALGLKSLINALKDKDVKMNDLLTNNDEGLKKLGITDQLSRHLILFESKKFNLKNWRSSSLIPVKQDSVLDCNEILSIISNLSRHSDYMSTNIKYLLVSLNDQKSEKKNTLFMDKYLSAKLALEVKQTLTNCQNLFNQIQSFSDYVSKNIGSNDMNAKPIDLIEPKNRSFTRTKLFRFCLTTGTLFLVYFSFKALKK